MPISQQNIDQAVASQIRVERISEKNVHAMNLLFRRVYRKHLPGNYFRKKYGNLSIGPGWLGHIAFKEDRAVACFGLIPCHIQFEKRIILAAQAVDGLTHPDFRRKGIFSQLILRTEELAVAAGVELLFGFPSESAYTTMINETGWLKAGVMHRFSLPADLAWYARLFPRSKFQRQHGLKRFAIHKMDFPNSMIEEGFGGILRDEHWVNYKSFSGCRIIGLGKGSLWVKAGKELLIGDIDMAGDDEVHFFGGIKKIARHAGLQTISFHASEGSRIHQIFGRKSTPLPSFPVIYKDLGSNIPMEKIKFTFGDIDIF